MELDRAVVLFDEIDELVRERGQDKADAFGRFLTTSMLPKVAELWSSRKLLYFVATNHVNLFDAAIIRSQRFDALLFVAPPSFEAKRERLNEIAKQSTGKTIDWHVGSDDCQDALENLDALKQGSALLGPEPDQQLAKFILLRWDQLEELVYQLELLQHDNPYSLFLDRLTLGKALEKIADPKLRQLEPYQSFKTDRFFERRDFGKYKVWRVDGNPPVGLALKGLERVDDQWWLRGLADRVEDLQRSGVDLAEERPGIVTIFTSG